VAVHSNYSVYLNAGTSSTCDEAKLQKAIITYHTQTSKTKDSNFISPFPIVQFQCELFMPQLINYEKLSNRKFRFSSFSSYQMPTEYIKNQSLKGC